MRFRTIALLAIVAALAAVFAAPLAAHGAVTDNTLPGVPLGTGATRTGTVSITDPWDIYTVPLAKGQKLYLTLDGSKKGGEAYAFLLSPTAKRVDPSIALAMTLTPGGNALYPQTLRFQATTKASTRPYSLVVFGSESYRLRWKIMSSDVDDDVPGLPLTALTSGDMSATADWSDVFRAELTTGQAIAAELHKPANADFQLGVFGPDPNPATIYFNTTGGQVYPWPVNVIGFGAPHNATTERLFFDVPKTGTYYLQATAFNGMGSYELSSTVLDPSALVDVAWEAPAEIMPSDEVTATGRLLDSEGEALVDDEVIVQRYDARNKSWTDTSAVTTTAADGGFTLPIALDANSRLRVRYAGEFAEEAPTSSEPAEFNVHATLGKPYVKRLAPKRFLVKGTLFPRHAAGTRPVELRIQRKIGSGWVTKFVVRPTVTSSGEYSRYSTNVSVPSSGMWRVVAYHAGDHIPVKSLPTFFRAYQ
ncbi:MAG: hypothetical protein HY876_09785 [Coriobacteriales bacterium]|nr:hypothetical protein [Coriobacteriales bacterium]